MTKTDDPDDERDIGVEVATAISDRNFEVFQQQLHARASEQEVTPERDSELGQLDYLEVNGKHGLFDGNLLIAVIGECVSRPEYAAPLAREVQFRCNSHAELKERVRQLEESTPQQYVPLRTFKTVEGNLTHAMSVNAELKERVRELEAALQATIKWMDFAAAKLGDVDDLDHNIRKYGARKWIKQFGEGAGHRAAEARAALSKEEKCKES